MRKLSLVLCISIFLCNSIAFASDLKIISFDLQKVATESEPFKEAQAAARKHIDPIKKRLEAKKKTLESDIKAAGATPEKSKRDELLNREKAYVEEATAFLKQVQESELTIRESMDDMIIRAAKNYATKNNASLAIDSRSILFSDNKVNIEDATKGITEEVNKVWHTQPKK